MGLMLYSYCPKTLVYLKGKLRPLYYVELYVVGTPAKIWVVL